MSEHDNQRPTLATIVFFQSLINEVARAHPQEFAVFKRELIEGVQLLPASPSRIVVDSGRDGRGDYKGTLDDFRRDLTTDLARQLLHPRGTTQHQPTKRQMKHVAKSTFLPDVGNIVKIEGCGYCGGDHEIIRRAMPPPHGAYTHWAICPEHNAPILLTADISAAEKINGGVAMEWHNKTLDEWTACEIVKIDGQTLVRYYVTGNPVLAEYDLTRIRLANPAA